MNQIGKALLSGPEPGVNYGKLTARAPELTAQVEEIDKSIFTMAQAMFFELTPTSLLRDQRPICPGRGLMALIWLPCVA
jgi:hypothetical protein